MNKSIQISVIERVFFSIFSSVLHKKTLQSIFSSAVGIIFSKNIKIHSIGEGLAKAYGKNIKHCIKQADRLLSNCNFDVGKLAKPYVLHIIGNQKEVCLAFDWTDFYKDNQSTLSVNLVTKHGRAIPLMFKTVSRTTLKNNTKKYETQLLKKLHAALPASVSVTLLADRGFSDISLFEFIEAELGWDYIIRTKGNINVTQNGVTKQASDWIATENKPVLLRNVLFTNSKFAIPSFVIFKDKKMKDPWILVSNKSITARAMIKYYGKRWGIEPSFRDKKNAKYGLGMSETHISIPDRRDRLLFIASFVIFVMTALGEVSEKLGIDRLLRANTSKYRTHSLFRQGLMLWDLLISMPESYLKKTIDEFNLLLFDRSKSTQLFESAE